MAPSADEGLVARVAELEKQLAVERKAVSAAKASAAAATGSSDATVLESEYEAEAEALRGSIKELEAALSREK